MTGAALETIEYEREDQQVTWQGVSFSEEDGFDAFITDDVASRLHDEEGAQELETHLRSLATTGFARENLSQILESEIPEIRDWAVGEAMAEAYLMRQYDVTWPWNMERDKRTPKASLPGADLVGFETDSENVRLVLGEVKTSSEEKFPPGVMNGRSGMKHQIDKLAANLSIIYQLIKWLWPRCKGNTHETSFNKAVGFFIRSGNKAIALFGILIRDTEPNELDLRARGVALACTLEEPSTCQLIALHPPCTIADLPARVTGGASSALQRGTFAGRIVNAKTKTVKARIGLLGATMFNISFIYAFKTDLSTRRIARTHTKIIVSISSNCFSR
jgi:hypothetical protein